MIISLMVVFIHKIIRGTSKKPWRLGSYLYRKSGHNCEFQVMERTFLDINWVHINYERTISRPETCSGEGSKKFEKAECPRALILNDP